MFKAFLILVVITSQTPKPQVNVFNKDVEFSTKEECSVVVEKDLKNITEKLSTDKTVKVIDAKGMCLTKEEGDKLLELANPRSNDNKI